MQRTKIMPPTSKEEQVPGNENMPSNTKEGQVAKDKKPLPASKEDCQKMIKQRQTARVERLLNRCIPKFRLAAEKYLLRCQTARDATVPPTYRLFATEEAEKDATTWWETINELCEKNSAALLFIDQFESELREQWKAKKKESAEKRHLYLRPKRREFRKMRNDREDVVWELHMKMGVKLPRVQGRDEDTTDEEADMDDLKDGVKEN